MPSIEEAIEDKISFLIIDDDKVFTQVLERSLIRQGFCIHIANDANSALLINQQYQPKRASLDLKLGNDSGLSIIKALKQANPELEIVVLTGYSSIATAVEAVKLGAKDYLCKPASSQEILNAFDDEDQSENTTIAESPPSVDRLEWEHIQRVLTQNHGNVSATARALGMHRRTLQRKLQKKPVKQ